MFTCWRPSLQGKLAVQTGYTITNNNNTARPPIDIVVSVIRQISQYFHYYCVYKTHHRVNRLYTRHQMSVRRSYYILVPRCDVQISRPNSARPERNPKVQQTMVRCRARPKTEKGHLEMSNCSEEHLRTSNGYIFKEFFVNDGLL